MESKPLIVGNWKMELSHKAAVSLAKAMNAVLPALTEKADIVVCPSYPSLAAVKDVFKESDVALGAQNVFVEDRGAYTGQVSVSQIKDFANWCIVGHSEVRALTREADETVVAKANLLLTHGLTPIVCIGETMEEKEVDETLKRISQQTQALLDGLSKVSLLKTVIAYEPIWAVGSGFMPQPDEVAEIILLIRKMVAARFDGQAAQRLKILYGGSVKPDTVAPYIGGPYANGVLVGGASVHTGQFKDIISSVIKAS